MHLTKGKAGLGGFRNRFLAKTRLLSCICNYHKLRSEMQWLAQFDMEWPEKKNTIDMEWPEKEKKRRVSILK